MKKILLCLNVFTHLIFGSLSALAGTDNPKLDFLPKIPPEAAFCNKPENYCGPEIELNNSSLAEWYRIRDQIQIMRTED